MAAWPPSQEGSVGIAGTCQGGGTAGQGLGQKPAWVLLLVPRSTGLRAEGRLASYHHRPSLPAVARVRGPGE